MRFQLTLNDDSERDKFILDKLGEYTNTKESNALIKFVLYRYFKGELVQQEAINSIINEKEVKIKTLEEEIQELKAQVEELKGIDKKDNDFYSFMK